MTTPPVDSLPDTITLDLTDFAHGGEAIGRWNGRVVFVHGGAAGDEEATVRLLPHQKPTARFLRAEFVTATRPSQLRPAEPIVCPAAAAGAGCCDFTQVDPAVAAEVKAGIALNQIDRIAHLDLDCTATSLYPHAGWRTRVRLAVGKDGRAGYRKHKSHDVIALATGHTECRQVVPGLLDNLDSLRFTPGSEIVIAVDSRHKRTIVELPAAPRGRHKGRRSAHPRIIEGDNVCVEDVDVRKFTLPATGFWQAHFTAADNYRAAIRRLLNPETLPASVARRIRSGVGWDLYGGVGVFGEQLAQITGGPVDSVEIDPDAAQWGQKSLRWVNSIDIRFVTDTVGNWSALRTNTHGGVDVAIVDPPRSGAGQKVIQGLTAAQPAAIIHIACDPANGARDFSVYDACGYSVADLEVIDAFPGTHHMEMIALLLKKQG